MQREAGSRQDEKESDGGVRGKHSGKREQHVQRPCGGSMANVGYKAQECSLR